MRICKPAYSQWGQIVGGCWIFRLGGTGAWNPVPYRHGGGSVTHTGASGRGVPAAQSYPQISGGGVAYRHAHPADDQDFGVSEILGAQDFGLGPELEPAPRCIAALCIDGGTRFVRRFDPDAVPDRVAEFFRVAQKVRTKPQADVDRQAGGLWLELPLPDSPLYPKRMPAIVTVFGDRRQYIRALVPDVAHWTIDLEGDESGAMLVCEAKAKALWAWGFAVWAEMHLALGSWMSGDELHSLVAAHRFGWHTSNLELCSDFVGVPWLTDDIERFVLSAQTAKRGLVTRVYRSGVVPKEAETLEVGMRKSNISWCLYRKTLQILRAKGGDASTYATAWKAGGWQEGQQVTRAEVRLRRHGLCQYDEDTGEVWDVREPRALCDRETLAALWAGVTRSWRLTVPRPSTRRDRWPVDVRWQAVQRAAGREPIRLRQDRAAQVHTWHEAWDRQARGSLRHLARLGGLLGVRPQGEDFEGWAELCRIAWCWHREAHPELSAELPEVPEAYAHGRATYLENEIFETEGPSRLLEARRWLGRELVGLEGIERPERQHVWAQSIVERGD